MKVITVTAINKTNPAEVFVVNPTRYYGVRSNVNNYKGFITREKFEEGDYITKCADLLTDGNDWGYNDGDLAGLINALRGNNFTVVEFNTSRDLFKWLVEL